MYVKVQAPKQSPLKAFSRSAIIVLGSIQTVESKLRTLWLFTHLNMQAIASIKKLNGITYYKMTLFQKLGSLVPSILKGTERQQGAAWMLCLKDILVIFEQLPENKGFVTLLLSGVL